MTRLFWLWKALFASKISKNIGLCSNQPFFISFCPMLAVKRLQSDFGSYYRCFRIKKLTIYVWSIVSMGWGVSIGDSNNFCGIRKRGCIWHYRLGKLEKSTFWRNVYLSEIMSLVRSVMNVFMFNYKHTLPNESMLNCFWNNENIACILLACVRACTLARNWLHEWIYQILKEAL